MTDYYPFGMMIDGRNVEHSFYRFSHNTQERSDEIAGKGNHHTALFWEYSPRIARRWNVDPVDQISISNYAVFKNNSICYIDIKGDVVNFMGYKNKDNAPMNDEQAEAVWKDIVAFLYEFKVNKEYDALVKSPNVYEVYFTPLMDKNAFTPNMDKHGEIISNVNSSIMVNPWQNLRDGEYIQNGVWGVIHEFIHAFLYNENPKQYYIESGTPGKTKSLHEDKVISKENEYSLKIGEYAQRRQKHLLSKGATRVKSWRPSWDKRDGSMPRNETLINDTKSSRTVKMGENNRTERGVKMKEIQLEN